MYMSYEYIPIRIKHVRIAIYWIAEFILFNLYCVFICSKISKFFFLLSVLSVCVVPFSCSCSV